MAELSLVCSSQEESQKNLSLPPGLGGGLRGGVDEESLWVEFSPNRMVCLSVCIYKSLKMLEDLGPGTFLSSYRLAAKRTKQKKQIFT